MANIYALRSRIKSVESTRKVTKTMKLVSTSKMHQVQSQLARLDHFAHQCREALSMVASALDGEDMPLMKPRPVKTVCYVLFVGNRGLCGSYNADVLRFLEELLKKERAEYFTLICGRWGGDRIDAERLHLRGCFDQIGDVPRQEQAKQINDCLEDLFLSGKADKVVLVHQSRNGMGQLPQAFQLLPLVQQEHESGGDCLFEPDKESLVETLCRMYVENDLNRVLLEAKVSEHFARMTAMTNATDNADELLRQLELRLNRTRQAKITTEISEVVGGANALRNGE